MLPSDQENSNNRSRRRMQEQARNIKTPVIRGQFIKLDTTKQIKRSQIKNEQPRPKTPDFHIEAEEDLAIASISQQKRNPSKLLRNSPQTRVSIKQYFGPIQNKQNINISNQHSRQQYQQRTIPRKINRNLSGNEGKNVLAEVNQNVAIRFNRFERQNENKIQIEQIQHPQFQQHNILLIGQNNQFRQHYGNQQHTVQLNQSENMHHTILHLNQQNHLNQNINQNINQNSINFHQINQNSRQSQNNNNCQENKNEDQNQNINFNMNNRNQHQNQILIQENGNQCQNNNFNTNNENGNQFQNNNLNQENGNQWQGQNNYNNLNNININQWKNSNLNQENVNRWESQYSNFNKINVNNGQNQNNQINQNNDNRSKSSNNNIMSLNMQQLNFDLNNNQKMYKIKKQIYPQFIPKRFNDPNMSYEELVKKHPWSLQNHNRYNCLTEQQKINQQIAINFAQNYSIRLNLIQQLNKYNVTIQERNLRQIYSQQACPYQSILLQNDNFYKQKIIDSLKSPQQKLYQVLNKKYYPRTQQVRNNQINWYQQDQYRNIIYSYRDAQYVNEYKQQISHYKEPKVILITKQDSYKMRQKILNKKQNEQRQIKKRKQKYQNNYTKYNKLNPLSDSCFNKLISTNENTRSTNNKKSADNKKYSINCEQKQVKMPRVSQFKIQKHEQPFTKTYRIYIKSYQQHPLKWMIYRWRHRIKSYYQGQVNFPHKKCHYDINYQLITNIFTQSKQLQTIFTQSQAIGQSRYLQQQFAWDYNSYLNGVLILPLKLQLPPGYKYKYTYYNQNNVSDLIIRNQFSYIQFLDTVTFKCQSQSQRNLTHKIKLEQNQVYFKDNLSKVKCKVTFFKPNNNPVIINGNPGKYWEMIVKDIDQDYEKMNDKKISNKAIQIVKLVEWKDISHTKLSVRGQIQLCFMVGILLVCLSLVAYLK